MSITGEIEKLEAMRKEGTLTEEEFAAAKRRLLKGGKTTARERADIFSDWRFVTVAVLAVAAIGVLAWQYFGAEPEPDPTLSLVSLLVLALCVRLIRPVGGGIFGGDDETSIPLIAILTVGAGVLAGGAFLIGLPLIALGLAAIAVIGFVMWCWNGLFGG